MLKSRIPEIVLAIPAEVDKALIEGGDLVVEEAQVLVPVKTGALHDNIKAVPVEEGVEVRAGTRRVFYGRLVEFGHAKKGGGQVPPHPFLVPALEHEREAILQLTIKAIQEAVAGR